MPSPNHSQNNVSAQPSAQTFDDPARALDIYARLTHGLIHSTPLEDILAEVAQMIIELSGVERCTLFMFDANSHELYTKASMNEAMREIRFPRDKGIAGETFCTGETQIIPDAYADPRFNPEVDKQTGYKTRNILSHPISYHVEGQKEIIGVVQVLNKMEGASFDQHDVEKLEPFLAITAPFLINAHIKSKLHQAQSDEEELLEISTAMSGELKLMPLLNLIMASACQFLEAEKSTLFMHDPENQELWTGASRDANMAEVRFADHLGLAGHVLKTGETLNIEDAYQDQRFNGEVDKKTGYRTRSLICMPVRNRKGECIAVTQVLNKKVGCFSTHDERRLEAFSSQAAIAIENAQLFDEVLRMRNYNESILQSMSNGIITFAQDGSIEKVNQAANNILKVQDAESFGNSDQLFTQGNRWLHESIKDVIRHRQTDSAVDIFLEPLNQETGSDVIAINLNMVPLEDQANDQVGCLMVMEDLSKEKRLKNTMARYMSKEVADRLLLSGADVLGGQMHKATILFTDIRQFTNLSEAMGAHETVDLLNEYFSVMADIVHDNDGILDKYIGDSIMAVFGVPFNGPNDPDNAVRAGMDMLRGLRSLNSIRERRGEAPIAMGIGIHTDEVVSGNIGSPKRMDYTVIGDGVNLASRLEGVTKIYGTGMLVSETTFHALKQQPPHRLIDRLRVKGKSEAVSIFQVCEANMFPQQDMDNFLTDFSQARELYEKGSFLEAQSIFETVEKLIPEDRPTQVYLERCRQLQANPPAAWDGIWTMESK